MQQTPLQNKRKLDMFKAAEQYLRQQIGNDWGYDAREADPLVQLLIGACASEAQHVYDDLIETDDRLLQRVLHYLLPEAFLTPTPAATIAAALLKKKAAFSSVLLSEKQTFVVRKNDKSLYFSPLFETKLLNGSVRFICTNRQVIDTNDIPNFDINNHQERISHFLIGIETAQKVTDLSQVAFYTDFKKNDAEKTTFLKALSMSEWRWNHQILNRQNGFLPPHSEILTDQLDPAAQWTNALDAQFRWQFQYINAYNPADYESKVPIIEPPVMAVLKEWFVSHLLPKADAEMLSTRHAGVKGNFIWLKIALKHEIVLTDVAQNIIFDLNRFIVVNRRLVEQNEWLNMSENYTRRALEVLEIKPKQGLFQSIKTIYERNAKQNLELATWSKLLKLKKPLTYSLRLGGVGRADSYNAWQRYAYLLSVFRKEHRQQELVKRLGDVVSLEDLHQIIGEQVSKVEAQQVEMNKTLPVYLFVQPPSKEALDLKIEYWVTDGLAAEGLPAKSELFAEPASPDLMPFSIQFVERTAGGKNAASASEQVQMAQDALFRRDRIVSQADIKSLCHLKMGKLLKKVTIQTIFTTDSETGIQRIIEVVLSVENANDSYCIRLAQEIEWELKEKAVGIMPYRVSLSN
jgi:hypothetical protein